MRSNSRDPEGSAFVYEGDKLVYGKSRPEHPGRRYRAKHQAVEVPLQPLPREAGREPVISRVSARLTPREERRRRDVGDRLAGVALVGSDRLREPSDEQRRRIGLTRLAAAEAVYRQTTAAGQHYPQAPNVTGDMGPHPAFINQQGEFMGHQMGYVPAPDGPVLGAGGAYVPMIDNPVLNVIPTNQPPYMPYAPHPGGL